MSDKLKVTVSFVGAGRLAWSLIPAFQKAGLAVEGIYSRDEGKAKTYAAEYQLERWGNIPKSISSDLVLLTVADHAIESVSRNLDLPPQQIVCHCSGSVAMNAVSSADRHGVFYPMQAFTDQRVVEFHEDKVPVFVEGSSENVTSLLKQLGHLVGYSVEALSSDQRQKLHLGAVLACNFPNLLFQYAARQVEGVGLEAYESLIRHQVNQALILGPEAAQTGPAIRGDEETIRAHLHQLEGQPQLSELYRMISRMINPDLPDSL